MTITRTQVIISFIDFPGVLSDWSAVENFITNILELVHVLVLLAVFLVYCRYTIIYIAIHIYKYICICILHKNRKNELDSDYGDVLRRDRGSEKEQLTATICRHNLMNRVNIKSYMMYSYTQIYNINICLNNRMRQLCVKVRRQKENKKSKMQKPK